jgi:hypothetical protein
MVLLLVVGVGKVDLRICCDGVGGFGAVGRVGRYAVGSADDSWKEVVA